MNSNREQTINKFQDIKILVVGDAMLDTYYYGVSDRLCREAPVPIVSVSSVEHVPGGAANAAVNVASLGAQTTFVSVRGDDEEGNILARRLQHAGISVEALFVDEGRLTLGKKRIYASSQLLVRYDRGTTSPLQGKAEDDFIDFLIDQYHAADAVILSDYGYGVFTEGVIGVLAKLQKISPRLLVVDAKQAEKFATLHPTLVKPNYQEALHLLGTPKETASKRVEQLRNYRDQLFAKTNANIVAVSIDRDGSIVFDRSHQLTYQTFAKAVENIKAIGAGDTYVAAFALALAAGAESTQAAELAAKASEIVVQKKGTASCTRIELRSFLQRQNKYIASRDEILGIISHYRESKKRIVFTNGCFDLIHSGHVTYLNQAKNLGDILIVGINDDASIKRLKGESRPINSLEERMEVLAGLSSIDHIVSFSEDTPVSLIQLIQPDVFVKGGDYTLATLPEADILKKLGARIELIPIVKNRSTSNIISKIANLYGHT